MIYLKFFIPKQKRKAKEFVNFCRMLLEQLYFTTGQPQQACKKGRLRCEIDFKLNLWPSVDLVLG